MPANVPVLPIAGATVVRAAFALIAMVARWFKALARARRHRREAHMLAGLDQRMLADMGLSRADVRDAFSEPFWEDPTALLRERALERRLYRPRFPQAQSQQTDAFRRPPTDRPARHSV